VWTAAVGLRRAKFANCSSLLTANVGGVVPIFPPNHFMLITDANTADDGNMRRAKSAFHKMSSGERDEFLKWISTERSKSK
jgi:hypothetical protein